MSQGTYGVLKMVDVGMQVDQLTDKQEFCSRRPGQQERIEQLLFRKSNYRHPLVIAYI